MAEKYDEYEAADVLASIAKKLKEVDRALQDAYRHFTPDVIELIEKADPKGEMDPGYWSKQMKLVADAILEERTMKDDAGIEPVEQKASAPSPARSFGYGPSF